MSDVTVERTVGRETVTVISRESGVVGESLAVEVPGAFASLEMVVAESRPVIVSGAVRHRIQMRRSTAAVGRSSERSSETR